MLLDSLELRINVTLTDGVNESTDLDVSGVIRFDGPNMRPEDAATIQEAVMNGFIQVANSRKSFVAGTVKCRLMDGAA